MIVFVDDEAFILEFIRHGLAGYKRPYMMCHSVQEAKSIIEEASQTVELVVTDLHMAGESGYDLIHWLCQYHPHIKKVILSAHSHEHEIREQIGSCHIEALLRKPINVENELVPIIEMILKD